MGKSHSSIDMSSYPYQLSDEEWRKKLTPQEHWDLHQGLWYMLGCNMEIKYQDNNNIVYVDKKENIQYTYSALGILQEKQL